MKKYSIVLILLVFSSIAFSQDVIEENTLSQTPSFLKGTTELPQEGTYQIIVDNKDIITNITKKTLLTINKKRQAENITYIVINEYVKIKILPYSVIRAKGFVPLKKYSYEK